MTSDINTSTLGVRTKLRDGQHGNEIKLMEGSDRKKFEPGGEECNDSTCSGRLTSVTTYMLEGREQVNVPVPRKPELSDPHLLTRSAMTHGSRGRMRHPADDRDLCYGAEVNAAQQWVKSISDVTGSGVSYTTGQLQVTCSSDSSDYSCVNVERR